MVKNSSGKIVEVHIESDPPLNEPANENVCKLDPGFHTGYWIDTRIRYKKLNLITGFENAEARRSSDLCAAARGNEFEYDVQPDGSIAIKEMGDSPLIELRKEQKQLNHDP